MKQIFFILAAVVMAFVMTSCNQKATGMEDSLVMGKWQCDINNMTMTLVFGEKTVEYGCYTILYKTRATYYGTYKVNDKTITLNLKTLETNNVTHPKPEYIAPDKMPKEAVLNDDASEILYLNQTFKRVN